MKNRKQTGASLVELIFVMPLFLGLVGAIIEMGYVYRSKSTLNSATLDSVREGAVSNASKAKMRTALAAGMMPLYTFGETEAGGIAVALGKSIAFEKIMSTTFSIDGLDTIQIISPTKSVYNAFVKDIPILEGNKVELVEAIPNDNLMYRSTALRNVTVAGRNVRLNIQDANLIKIKSFWCHRLKIPGLRDVAKKLILSSALVNRTREQTLCNRVGEIPGPYEGVYVAITAQAITRAQSPIYSKDLD